MLPAEQIVLDCSAVLLYAGGCLYDQIIVAGGTKVQYKFIYYDYTSIDQ